MIKRTICTLATLVFLVSGTVAANLDFTIKLKTGAFQPAPMRAVPQTAQALQGKHILVQFDGPMTQPEMDQLKSIGINLINYIPNYAFTARLEGSLSTRVMQDHRIRWFGAIKPERKISPIITEMGIRDYARRGGNKVQFAVVIHKDEDIDYWADKLRSDYNAEIIGTVPAVGIIDLIMDEPMYFRVSELDAVVWIEQAMPRPIELNNKARANTGAETVQAAPFNLTGAGVTVAEWDGGAVDRFHTDFGSRVFVLDGSTVATHATHVAGTVVGDGFASSGVYRGMAPGANLLSQLWWGSSSEMAGEYNEVINGWGATIATNSWGYGVGNPATWAACENTLGNYASQSAALDELVRGSQGKPISICWAAGNQRSTSSDQCGSLGWDYGTVGTLPTSKNVISVGAIGSTSDAMTSFSSWGPTDDGRLKPDVVGPGCILTSCKPNGGYTSMCGTSMSTPATAGVLALLREQWETYVGTGELLPSTIKGILINTAIDLGRPGPDFSFGHGKIDAVTAATKIAIGQPSYVQDSITTGASDSYNITVLGSAPKLKVTLVWSDPGGSPSTSQNLINDLDLVLVDPFSNQKYPWVLDPSFPQQDATTGEDHKNNVETVEIDNPTAGIWTAVVQGTNIPTGPQSYSLIFTPDSSYTPGSQVAVAAFAGSDVSADPGTTAQADFWASNVGANPDSLHIQITDDSLWLQGTLDTVVFLNPFDSAHFVVFSDIPATALSQDFSQITISVNSLTNPLVKDQNALDVVTNTTYAVSIEQLGEDTVLSPDMYPIDVMIINNGNGTDSITVIPSDERGWTFSPSTQTLSVPPSGGSILGSITVLVPAEVPHLSVNNITIEAISSGGVADSTTFPLIANNSVFPPQLLSPDTVVYSQDRLYTFSWTDDGSDSYTLYIATDQQISNLVHVYTGLSTGTFALPTGDSLADGSYYWAVRKFVGGDSSSFQLVPHQVVVDNIPPLSVTADAPAEGSYLPDNFFTFSFSESGTASPATVLSPEFATIQLSQDSLFTSGVTEYTDIEGFSFMMPDSLPEGSWFWRVKRFDLASNVTSFTPRIGFVLDTETPAIPALLLPADNYVLSDDPLMFVWQNDPPAPHDEAPEYYFIHVSNKDDFTDFSTFSGFIYDTSVALSASNLQLGQMYWWHLRTFDSAGHASVYSQPFSFTYRSFICGNIDSSGTTPDIGDLTYLITYLFAGGPPPDPMQAGSVDCNGVIDIGDVTYLVTFLFQSGPEPCCL